MPAGPGPEGSLMGPWFVIPVSGTVQRQTNPILASLLAATATGFKTDAAAQAYADSHALLHGTSPGGQATGATVGAAESVGSFLGRLTQKATWIRVAEGVIGGLLLLFGINGLIHAATGVDVAGKVARGAAVGAML